MHIRNTPGPTAASSCATSSVLSTPRTGTTAVRLAAETLGSAVA